VPLLPFVINISRRQPKGRINNRKYNKVFIIGFNKTGTTTLKHTLMSWGLKPGNQKIACMMMEDYKDKRYERIFSLVETADVFQDIPFSAPEFFIELDKQFPESKFILSVRDSEDQWFDSMLNAHSKKAGRKPPMAEDLSKVTNIYEGWLLDAMTILWDYPSIDLYNEQLYKKKYLDHIQKARKYFGSRSDDYIEINVSRQKDFGKLAKFLDVSTKMKNFPWANKTQE